MSNFLWTEIKLPPEYYTAGKSFAEAFSISPDSRSIVGTFGERLFGDPRVFSGFFEGFLKPPLSSSGDQMWGHYQVPENRGEVEGATSARGINDFGVVVGLYRDENRNREIHGYLWPSGAEHQIDFDVPGATYPDADDPDLHNAVLGINNQGFVVGRFRQAIDQKDYGFVWGPQSTPTMFPKTVDLSPFADGVTSTTVNGINSYGDIVGSFTRNRPSPSGPVQTQGYKWKVDLGANSGFRLVGDPIIIDITVLPRSSAGATVPARLDTIIWGINDSGWIVGGYNTFEARPAGFPSPTNHGFVWKPRVYDQNNYVAGEHVTIDILDDTVVSGIANSGVFVGAYTDRLNGTGRHAFLGIS